MYIIYVKSFKGDWRVWQVEKLFLDFSLLAANEYVWLVPGTENIEEEKIATQFSRASHYSE